MIEKSITEGKDCLGNQCLWEPARDIIKRMIEDNFRNIAQLSQLLEMAERTAGMQGSLNQIPHMDNVLLEMAKKIYLTRSEQC